MSSEVDLSGLTGKKNRAGTRYFVNSDGEIVAKECRYCLVTKYLVDFNKGKKTLGGCRTDCRTCQSRRGIRYVKENRNNPQFRKRRAESQKKYYESVKDCPEFKRKRTEQRLNWYINNHKHALSYSRGYYKSNREKYLEYSRKEYEGNREFYLEYARRYREENPDRFKESKRMSRLKNPDTDRLYYLKNKGWYSEYRLNWQRNNEDKVALHNSSRRARVKGLPRTLTIGQWESIYSKFGNGCALTREQGNLHRDHVIPLATGYGGTTAENMIPLRADLNSSKNDRCIFDWFADNRERFELSQQKFDELIEYLADINDMTTAEYEEYVRWCHDNPRDLTIQDEYDESLTKTS